MAYMRSQIEQRYAEPLVSGERKTQVVVHVANSFEGYYTYDGIDVCGIRVANGFGISSPCPTVTPFTFMA